MRHALDVHTPDEPAHPGITREEHYSATRRAGLEFLNFGPPATYITSQAGPQNYFPIVKGTGAIPFGQKDTFGASRRKHNQL